MKNMTKHLLKITVPEKKIVIQKKHEVTVELETKDYVSNKISFLRKEKGINQEELSALIGISRVSLSNIESGRQALSLKLLERICEELNLSSNEILPF